jgi:hypothetical protein
MKREGLWAKHMGLRRGAIGNWEAYPLTCFAGFKCFYTQCHHFTSQTPFRCYNNSFSTSIFCVDVAYKKISKCVIKGVYVDLNFIEFVDLM